jgi:hypothetical protein
MTTGNGAGDADKTRAEVEKTRDELGETVRALAVKTDVKARGQEKAAHARDRIREQAAQTTKTVREKAVRAPRTVGQRTAQSTKTVGQKAVQSAKAAGQKGARSVKALGTPVYQARSKIRRNPAALAALAVTAIAVYALQRKRRKVAPPKGWSTRWNAGQMVRPWKESIPRSHRR